MLLYLFTADRLKRTDRICVWLTTARYFSFEGIVDADGAIASGAPVCNFAKNISESAFVGKCSCDAVEAWWYCMAGDCIRWSFMEYGSSD